MINPTPSVPFVEINSDFSNVDGLNSRSFSDEIRNSLRTYGFVVVNEGYNILRIKS